MHKKEGWVGIIKVPILPLIHNVQPESEATPAVAPKPKPLCQRFGLAFDIKTFFYVHRQRRQHGCLLHIYEGIRGERAMKVDDDWKDQLAACKHTNISTLAQVLK